MAGGFRLDVGVFNETQVSRQFVNAGAFLADPEVAFHRMADAFMEAEKRQFRSEGGNTGGWDGLADATVEQRTRLGIGGAHPILDRTGASYDNHTGGQLMRSLTVKGDANQELIITKNTMVLRSTVPYGPMVQKKRKAFGLTEADKKMPFRIFQDELMTAARA